jgi:hypothetical protein
MSDDVIIPADIAQQIAEILRQNPDPSIQQLAGAVDPPPPVSVPSILQSVTNLVSSGISSSIDPQSISINILSYVSNRLLEILSDTFPTYFAEEISDIIKNN